MLRFIFVGDGRVRKREGPLVYVVVYPNTPSCPLLKFSSPSRRALRIHPLYSSLQSAPPPVPAPQHYQVLSRSLIIHWVHRTHPPSPYSTCVKYCRAWTVPPRCVKHRNLLCQVSMTLVKILISLRKNDWLILCAWTGVPRDTPCALISCHGITLSWQSEAVQIPFPVFSLQNPTRKSKPLPLSNSTIKHTAAHIHGSAKGNPPTQN